jgi:hypothetical protein
MYMTEKTAVLERDKLCFTTTELCFWHITSGFQVKSLELKVYGRAGKASTAVSGGTLVLGRILILFMLLLVYTSFCQ